MGYFTVIVRYAQYLTKAFFRDRVAMFDLTAFCVFGPKAPSTSQNS